jgi:hypothetical protein
MDWISVKIYSCTDGSILMWQDIGQQEISFLGSDPAQDKEDIDKSDEPDVTVSKAIFTPDFTNRKR